MLNKNQSHEVEIVIGEDGKVSTVIHGVEGPACHDLAKWLDKLGTVEVDSPTDDYRKQPRQGITVSR